MYDQVCCCGTATACVLPRNRNATDEYNVKHGTFVARQSTPSCATKHVTLTTAEWYKLLCCFTATNDDVLHNAASRAADRPPAHPQHTVLCHQRVEEQDRPLSESCFGHMQVASARQHLKSPSACPWLLASATLLVVQVTAARQVALNCVRPGQQDQLEVWNSPLSEAAVLGFEVRARPCSTACARSRTRTPLCSAAASTQAMLRHLTLTIAMMTLARQSMVAVP